MNNGTGFLELCVRNACRNIERYCWMGDWEMDKQSFENRLIKPSDLQTYTLEFNASNKTERQSMRIVFCGDIENAPTVDAVEVVRCKDCKYFDGDTCFNNQWWNDDFFTYVKEDDFCSYGERREGE